MGKTRLTKADKQYVLDNLTAVLPKKMAEVLKVQPYVIEDWIKKQKLKPLDEIKNPEIKTVAEEVVIKTSLRDSLIWKQLKLEFTNLELKRFEEEYLKFSRQFREDIEPSEDLQLFQMLKLELLISRNLVDQKSVREEIKLSEQELANFLSSFPGGVIPPNDTNSQAQQMNLRNHISQLRAQISSLTTEHQKLTSETKYLLKDLKATRRDRVQELSDKNISWLQLIKDMEDAEIREKELKSMELVKAAATKEYRRLSKPFKFANGQQDLPILSHESIATLEEGNQKEEG